jgi:hypothetical protein
VSDSELMCGAWTPNGAKRSDCPSGALNRAKPDLKIFKGLCTNLVHNPRMTDRLEVTVCCD